MVSWYLGHGSSGWLTHRVHGGGNEAGNRGKALFIHDKKFELSAVDSRGLWNDFKKSCSLPKSVLRENRAHHLEEHGREG